MIAALWGWLTGSGADAEADPLAETVPVMDPAAPSRSDAAIRAALEVLQSRRGYGEFTMGVWDVDIMRDAIAAADAVDRVVSESTPGVTA